MKAQRASIVLATITVVALAVSGCADAGNKRNPEWASARSLEDFGTFEDLEAAAKEEGALNVIALPRDWASFGEILDLFMERYPEIEVTEANPDGSSAEEIQAARNLAGQDTAPDVFDLGLAVAMASTDHFAPYQVQTWADIPDALKEASGLYYADYGGYVSIGYDPDVVPEPTSLRDLLKPEYRGAVTINGDPTESGVAFATVAFAALHNGGGVDDFQPGIDFFAELNQAGNFLKLNPTPATIASGETPVVFDWDYLNVGYGNQVEGQRNWEVVVFPDVGLAGYYYMAINADAPNPAAARLWMEFIYSDEVQNLFLKGGSRPARAEAMADAGTIDAELYDALPPVPAETVVPTPEQSEAGSKLLSEKWATAVQ